MVRQKILWAWRSAIGTKMGAVSEYLVAYLDNLDERFLEYLDEDEQYVHGHVEGNCARYLSNFGKAWSTASARSASSRCRYRVVVVMLECPKSRWTKWMSTPRRSRLVA